MLRGSETALVGRAREREAIAGVVRALPDRPGMVVALDGEPGIGKSRLLAHLATVATEGATVLGTRASEFESDLPYALWTEALDGHLADAGDRRIARLGLADPGALAALLPAVATGGVPAAPGKVPAAPGGVPAAPGDRHRTHRALRDLLERLAATRPLVVWMDDVHWADPPSLDALAALVRRPPAAPVLLAVAAREGQMPADLARALAAAHGEERVLALTLSPLSEPEAVELVGDAAAALFTQTGGNPFYLEQLARVRETPLPVAAATDDTVPPPVAAALAAELAALPADARAVLDAAAVVGDPFEPSLAAAVAELPEPEALQALDGLLVRGLVRPAAPGRFAFRHPVVRHAVYVAALPGWRLGAHARAAEAMELRGAGPVQRAHHVEHAARPGDEPAIALLAAAAAELQAPAPRIAARFHAACLRVLPEHPDQRARRIGIQRRLADAEAAAGDTAAARQTLLDALAIAQPEERLALTVALANQEWWLGGHEEARRRLQVALGELPAQPSPDRVRLRLALSLTALLASDLGETRAHASDAAADARALGDPVFEVAALAAGALAAVAAGDGTQELDASTAALERLTADQLALRLPAFWMHGRARRMLGRFEAALADLRRGAATAAETGRERILLILTVESVAPLIELGRIAEAGAAAQEGLERARLSGNPRMELWAQCAQARALLAAGDVAGALSHAEEAAADGTRPDFHAAGEPGWALGAALTAAGRPERAVPVMLAAFGGPELARVLPADRPAAAADLVDAQLALGDLDAAEASAAHHSGITRASVLLASERPREAVEVAAGAVRDAAGAPLTSARAQLAHGRALAAAGERREAIDTLLAAHAAFVTFGAARRRDEAVRELRRLGHRVTRPSGGDGEDPLTAREREIAELVAAGHTNREIAEQLVLSTRTIEAHLRNVYGKLGVRTRVELARRA